MSFTPIKDVNLKILSELNDRDLLNACSTNKHAYSQICTDPHFWRNRLVKKYGEIAVKYKPESRSWKNHYMQIIIDLEKYQNDPMGFLRYIIWNPRGIEYSYYDPPTNMIPLSKAPEWVLNNLYLLDLGAEVIIWLENGFDENENVVFEKRVLSHPRPIQLLKLVSNKLISDQGIEKASEEVIEGFTEYTDEEGTPTEGYVAMIFR